ncbi:LysE family translocator [Breoghania sp.]|uniref:LysE family translocator n=1 Tax=Breoghania sp. TaxID=2065378 RepID=UPI00261EAA03|nr:LysE family translocator [Breoghania sp.]MDJ0931131.1 LysE family translocator [Breoghania sp.]
MTWELYSAYLVAPLIVLAIPGLTIMLVVSYALAQGRKTALASVTGVALGDTTAATLSLAGLGAVLATSATLFTILKWVGAAYLMWLDWKMWHTSPAPLETVATATRDNRTILAHAWIVTALNPKGIAFLLPHFIAPGAPVTPQLVLMGVTFVVLAIVNALAASAVREKVNRLSTLKAIHQLGGSVLIAAGLMTAAMCRATG